jgi:hypothetical protein
LGGSRASPYPRRSCRRHCGWLGRIVIPSDVSLKFFTTIATLGTPQDITVQEIRIESFFPMDDATSRFFRKSP